MPEVSVMEIITRQSSTQSSVSALLLPSCKYSMPLSRERNGRNKKRELLLASSPRRQVFSSIRSCLLRGKSGINHAHQLWKVLEEILLDLLLVLD